jgi:DnaJ-domain-containing protein 1
MEKELILPEKFLLLAHHPRKGKFVDSRLSADYVKYGIIGAIFLDLSLKGAIELENKMIRVKGKTEDLYPEAEEIMQRLQESKKSRKAKYWIRKMGSKGNRYKKKMLQRTKDKGLIRIEKRKFLGLIPYQKTYLLKPDQRQKMLLRLREVLMGRQKAGNEEALLLGLIRACRVHRILVHQKGEQKKIRKALKQFMEENAIAGAVDQTLQEIQAAIFASIGAASAASAASSSG